MPPIPVRTGSVLRHAKVPALLVTDLTNIRYLTGLHLSAGYVIIRPHHIALYADDRYQEYAKSREQKTLTVKKAEQFVTDMQKMRSCGIESGSMTLKDFAVLKRKFPQISFKKTVDVIEECRRQKNEWELRCIHRACTMTRSILRDIPAMLQRGVTEEEMAWNIRVAAHDRGAEAMAFDTIVAFGKNTARPHHRPTSVRLKPGDLVQIDMGVKVQGYCSDFSRVFYTAKPTSEQKRAERALRAVHRLVVPLLRSGITTHELDRSARSLLMTCGYEREFSHALGHGVGLEIHEGVVLSGKRASKILLRREVVTIEPGLYFPGRFGMRIEDTHIVQ